MRTHLVRQVVIHSAVAAALATAFATVGAASLAAQSASRSSSIASRMANARSDSLRAAPARTVAAPTPAMPRLTAAMSALNANAARFIRIPEARPELVTLVDVRNVFKYSDDQKWYEEAIAKHERDITAMRATLQGSMVLRDMLYQRQLTMQHVVAVEVAPDGRSGTVYFRPE